MVPKATFYNLSADKQAKILAVLKTEFSSKPFNEVTVKTIVEQLGMARGSFYQYFEDLEDSYFYVLDQETEDIHLKFLECLTEQAGDLHAALQNFGQAMSQFVFDQDKYDLYYYRYLHWTDALSRDWHQKKRSYYRSFYAKLNGLDLDLEVMQYVKVVVHGLIERIFRDNLSQEQFLTIYQQQMEWIEKGIKE